ncbi:hypothetical protein E1B28_007449 [Marasmius oreades]|uniref:Uncharacterized protein n=1 Tax=Marasmius oreades TaxID=181124 RepID=A0A9P7S1V9_9AGAR|nr:uncharacterized protein E1B28_007449 [Marasmius oreades]KAG7093807.1 hypothetical protein E1B28_007449 [Marasmius oreades]
MDVTRALTPFGRFNQIKEEISFYMKSAFVYDFLQGHPHSFCTHYTCQSFYTSGGDSLFSRSVDSWGFIRYKHNGFKNDNEMEAVGKDPKECKAFMWKQVEDREARWKEGLSLYMHYDELARGSYKQEVLGDLSDLSDLSDASSDDELAQKNAVR